MMRRQYTLAALCVTTLGCAASSEPAPSPPAWESLIDKAAEAKSPRLEAPIVTHDGDCEVTLDTPHLLERFHVPFGTEVPYDSTPASSGPHYPVWLAYAEHQHPMDPRYYVHNLEHGGIVVLYACASADGCPELRNALLPFVSLPNLDAECARTQDPLDTQTRLLWAPEPDLTVPVAAAAWGWTYSATCVDGASLKSFILDHIGKGPEDFCSDGSG